MKFFNVDDQYRKYPELKKDEVEKLVEWSKTQKHLPVINEMYACAFLHACNYSLEVSKQTYDLWCTTRSVIPEFFGNRDVLGKDMIDCMNTIAIHRCTKTTPEGYRVFIVKLKNFEPGSLMFEHCIKLYVMIFEMLILMNGIDDGIVLVFDMKGCQIGHVARFGPLTMKKFLFFLEKTPPMRLKRIYFINAVPFVDKFLSLIRPFIGKESLDKLQVYSSMDTFHKVVPKEILPIDYGGSEGDMIDLSTQIYELLKENKEYFIEEEKNNRTNEKLRVGKPKDASDLFGIEGNFKKLDID